MAIFPISSSAFVDNQIIPYLDVDTRLSVLPLVNNAANKALDNEHFKKVFAKKYPDLAKSPYVFQVLRTFHPDKCWKAACWILAGSYRTISNFHFLSEAPLQLPGLKASKDNRLGEICGSSYADPASPVRQARLALTHIHGDIMRKMGEADSLAHNSEQIFHQNLTAFNDELSQLDEKDRITVGNLLGQHPQLFYSWVNDFSVDLSGDSFKRILEAEEGYAVLVENHIDLYCDEFFQLALNQKKVAFQLSSLEASKNKKIKEMCDPQFEDRASLIYQAGLATRNIDEDLARLNGEAHRLKLNFDQTFAKNVEANQDGLRQFDRSDQIKVENLLGQYLQLFQSWVKDFPEDFSVDSFRKILESQEGYAILIANHIDLYSDELLLIASDQKKLSFKYVPISKTFSECSLLQKEKGKLLDASDQIDEEIKALDESNPLFSRERSIWLLMHHDLLAIETEFPKGVASLEASSRLEKCKTKIQEILREVTPDAPIHPRDSLLVQEIYRRIQSLSMPTRGRIWYKLYEHSANGVQEVQWSERHFNEHMRVLNDLINTEIKHSNEHRELLEKGPCDLYHQPWYRKALALLPAGGLSFPVGLTRFDRTPFDQVTDQDRIKQASFKWKLLNQLLPETLDLPSDVRNGLEQHFRTSPMFDHEWFKSLAPKPQSE